MFNTFPRSGVQWAIISNVSSSIHYIQPPSGVSVFVIGLHDRICFTLSTFFIIDKNASYSNWISFHKNEYKIVVFKIIKN